jgi:iron(III) transport system ATP-binding protein
MSVEITGLTKTFGAVRVLDDLTTLFRSEAISVLLGPSGCGKTTMLRCIAGLEQPSAGTIEIDGVPVFSDRRKINLPPEKRHLGMVFQSYAIWPHMTVFENVALPLRARGMGAADIRRIADETLALVGLSAMRDRGATQLSGGQQQRVAIARCVASRPRLILLDEPLSNLDAKLRTEMRKELKDLQRLTNATMVFVTHDQEEAMSLADTIFLFRSGRIVQQGTPAEIYRKPLNRYVAEFLGKANIFAVSVSRSGNSTDVRTRDGNYLIAEGVGLPEGHVGEYSCLIRPECWRVRTERDGGLPGTVRSLMFLGDRTELVVATPIGDLLLLLPGYRNLAPGDLFTLAADPAQIHLFEKGLA